jgi:hypothetical protein
MRRAPIKDRGERNVPMILSVDDGEDSGAPVSPHKGTRVE